MPFHISSVQHAIGARYAMAESDKTRNQRLPHMSQSMSMQHQCRTCGFWHDAPFIPTRAVLGHPKGHARDFELEDQEGRIATFSRELQNAMSSIDIYSPAVIERVTVMTSEGLTGPVAQADFVVVTGMGVFVISRTECDGFVSPGKHQHSLVLQGASAGIRQYRSPLRCTMAVVSFLQALYADFTSPIEALSVFDNERCTLGRRLPTSLITTKELHHYFRIRRDNAYRTGWSFEQSQMAELLLSACKKL